MIRTKRVPGWAALAMALALVAGGLLPAAPAQAAPAMQSSAGPDKGDEIVYIDGGDGFIRVLDTAQNAGPLVQWISPESGWREIALGDFNADGDMEIIAIKGSGADSKLVIYDPVVANAAIPPDGKINSIPWAKLFELPLPSRPTLIAAGNFDAGVNGDEFIVGFEIAPGAAPEAGKFFKLQIYKQTSQAATGRTWMIHKDNIYTQERWDRASVGHFIGGATEEIALVDEDGDNPDGQGEQMGKLEVYRTDTGWTRVFSRGSKTSNYMDALFGQWDKGGPEELAAVRSAEGTLASAFVLKFDEDKTDTPEEQFTSAFDPDPRRVAFADVDGDEEDELFLLRNAPVGSSLARLIGRNRGNGAMTEWEDKLGDSNDFRSIVGGDLDGDGRDELILARAGSSASSNDIIRVYRDAANTTENKQDYPLRNNRRTLLTGNLNAIGFSEGAVFAVDKEVVELTVAAGEAAQATVKLRNSTTAAAVPFSVRAENNPPWLTFTPASGNTPANNGDATITLSFNARDLGEGIYRSRLYIDSSGEVANKPISVVITLNVTPARLLASPAAIYYTGPCSDTTALSQTVEIKVYGTEGITYTASILDAPTFLAASAALGDSVNGAAINDDGALVLTNPNGEWVEMPAEVGFAGAVGAAAVADRSWPSGVPWLSASSDTGRTIDTLKLTIEPALMTSTDEQRAFVVLIGDGRTGNPPANVRFVQVFACTNVRFLPIAEN